MSLGPQAFTPGQTITVAGGNNSSSAATALGKPSGQGPVVRCTAEPANAVQACFKFGDSTVQAAATDTPLDPGDEVFIQVPYGATHVAVFGVAGTPNVDFTSGYGSR